MGIYHYPAPPPNIGAAQPYAPRQLPPSITAVRVDPPPSTLGDPPTIPSSIAAMWQPDPWVFLDYGRAGQPYARQMLAPGIPGQSGDQPPFSNENRSAEIAKLIGLWQPDPWQYSPIGKRQAYEGRQLSPGIPGQSADQPVPSAGGGPLAIKLQTLAVTWPDWSVNAWPYTFLGARQPYDPRKVSAGVPGQSADNPTPSAVGGPRAQKQLATLIAQPDWGYSPWAYDFIGWRQPYQGGRVPSGTAGVVANVPPFTHFGRTAAYRSIREAWNPPPPDFVMQMYASRIQPFKGVDPNRPTARGYVIL